MRRNDNISKTYATTQTSGATRLSIVDTMQRQGILKRRKAPLHHSACRKSAYFFHRQSSIESHARIHVESETCGKNKRRNAPLHWYQRFGNVYTLHWPTCVHKLQRSFFERKTRFAMFCDFHFFCILATYITSLHAKPLKKRIENKTKIYDCLTLKKLTSLSYL